MQLNRQALSDAIFTALSLFAEQEPSPNELEWLEDHLRLTDAISAEMTLGVSRIPCKVLPQDLQSFICVLLATKVIARCETNADREAALRLLYSAASELSVNRFPEHGERVLIPVNAGDELQPWPSQTKPPQLPTDIPAKG